MVTIGYRRNHGATRIVIEGMTKRSLRVRPRVCVGLVIALSICLLAGCGSAPHGASRHEAAIELRADHVQRAELADGLDYTSVVRGNARLGYELLKLIDDGSNVVISPLSLSYAMAMVREGTRGTTAAEIDRVLGFPRSGLGPLYNGVGHSLQAANHDATVALNDAIFIAPTFSVRRAYLAQLARYYGAGVWRTTFPDPALHEINSWVNEKTKGRIPKLLDQLDPSTVFALVNTLYLKAKWATAFKRSDTKQTAFHRSAGSTSQVETMSRTGSMAYVDGKSYQAVRLPYRGGRLSMWVLLPKPRSANPIGLLDPRVVSMVTGSAHPASVVLHLPRWDIKTNETLTEILQQLGIKRLFTSGADLSAMSPDGPVVTKVVQQANITVGEKGTEAAAATAVLGETSATAPPKNPVVVNVDHPFAFVIVDNTTHTPLFEGVVNNPSIS
jgi:serpin B